MYTKLVPSQVKVAHWKHDVPQTWDLKDQVLGGTIIIIKNKRKNNLSGNSRSTGHLGVSLF